MYISLNLLLLFLSLKKKKKNSLGASSTTGIRKSLSDIILKKKGKNPTRFLSYLKVLSFAYLRA